MPNPLHDRLLAPHAGSERPFIRHAGGTLSHGAFAAEGKAMAGRLAGLGLVPGDRVAAQVAKSAHALALYAGCVQAGLVFLPLNPGYTRAEVEYFVTDAEAALLVCDPASRDALAALAPRVETMDAEGVGSLRAGAAEPGPVADRAEDDLAAILYTSGTTGRPKGAMLSHRNLMSNAEALVELWRFGPRDLLIHALPIFHTHGLFVAVNVTLAAGGALALMPRFDAGEALAWMGRGATAMMGVPTFYTRLLDEPGLTREACEGMRVFVSGSAPLLPETHAAFAERTGHAILERYGMTETNMIASNPYDGERRAGTVGFPLPGVELRIDGAAGEAGEIAVRGPNVTLGYWRMPEKTAEEMTEDGWFRTGDVGRLDPDGYLEIVGRAKDLVISGGFNVYPREVEAVLDAQPGVLESAVIGLPDPDLGEAVVAVLVAEPGAAPDLDAVSAALEGELARYKRPRRMILADALPRNAMGKVQKAVLRGIYSEG
jgi:malonyl-CoA/methylmalonyl-CoA synthetase